MPHAVRGRGAPRVLVPHQEALLDAAASGDERAFATLATALTPSLTRFAESILRDRDGSSDAVQEVWVAAWWARRTFTSVDHLVGWMFRGVRFQAISILRRRRRVATVGWGGEAEEESSLVAPPAAKPDAAACNLSEMMRQAVDRLPDAYRGAATLFYLHQQSLAEVANLLLLSRAAVKMRLHRARAWLRKHMQVHDSS